MNETEIPEELIEKYIVGLMDENPMKLTQYVLSIIGENIYKANVGSVTFSQNMDIDGKRFNVKFVGKIKEINGTEPKE